MESTRTRRHPALVAAAFLVALLGLAGCVGDNDGSGGGLPPPAGCDDTPVQQIVELINLERANEGLPPLAVDVRLAAAAQAHSEDMAATATMSHTGSTGSSPADRVTAAGYPYTALGENVAAGQPTAEDAVDDWMNSPGHRAAILNTAFEHLGVGLAYATTGIYPTYWTVDFGASSDGGVIPPDGCHP